MKVSSVVMTDDDADRIGELFEQAYAANEPVGYALQRIVKEMPHLTSVDIKNVVEDLAQVGGGMRSAQFDAMVDMAVIVGAVERMSGRIELSPEEAEAILRARAEQGDEEAAELLEQLRRAAVAIED